MEIEFYVSLTTALQSYGDDGRGIMKGRVQWNAGPVAQQAKYVFLQISEMDTLP